MLSEKKAKIVKEIESNIVREGLVNGVYREAHFTFAGNKFDIYADVYVSSDDELKKTESRIYKNDCLYIGSIVSNGRYRNCSLGNNCSLMEHQLLAVTLLEGASLSLILDDKAVINHKTISADSVRARQNKRIFIEQVLDKILGEDIEPDRELLKDICIPPCNVRDLEICSSSENYEHGDFIRTFDLYGVSISAHDVPMLKSLLIDRDYINRVIECYKEYGSSLDNKKILQSMF